MFDFFLHRLTKFRHNKTCVKNFFRFRRSWGPESLVYLPRVTLPIREFIKDFVAFSALVAKVTAGGGASHPIREAQCFCHSGPAVIVDNNDPFQLYETAPVINCS